jgi:transposase
MAIPFDPYPSDVSDEEWSFVVPYLTLLDPDAPQRVYPLRDLFDGLRWMIRTGVQWRYIPHNFPPWHAVYQQSRRWMAAGVFEKLVHDLRILLRICADRSPAPSAAIFDGRVMQSTPENGARAGYDGHKRKKGSKVHMARSPP